MTAGELLELAVESVGVRGDGIAHHEGEPIYLPLTAPGDRVRARLEDARGEGRRAQLVTLLQPGQRAAPLCDHFGSCGGCTLQHLSDAAYAAAKESWLRTALRQHGFGEVALSPLRRLRAGARRRARFAMRRPARSEAAVQIGFHARASHAVVDMRECAVLDPALFRLIEPLRELAAALLLPGGNGAATASLADTGVDLLLDLADAPALAALEAMSAFATAHDLARFAWRSPGQGVVPVALRRPVRMRFGGVEVDLPEDGFLQASSEADAALTEAVLAAIGGATRIAELYAGIGTFTFPLARRAAVHAVESSAAAVASLRAAAARAGLAGRISIERRDLESRPLLSEELQDYDAAVFDPPRVGARAQARMLAASRVPRIVAVSCNPATFARDARILADGGYRLASLQPIDCFLWSAQLELVARFDRD